MSLDNNDLRKLVEQFRDVVAESHTAVAKVQSNQYAELKEGQRYITERLDNQDKASAAFRAEIAPMLKDYKDQQARNAGYENAGNLAVKIGKVIGAIVIIFAAIKYSIWSLLTNNRL